MKSTKQIILDLLNANGMTATRHEAFVDWHCFTLGVVGYDDVELPMIYAANEDDSIVTFISPAICEYDDESFAAVINAMNDMSIKSPFVKPVIIGENSVWLYYDHQLIDQKPTLKLIQHMTATLVKFAIELLNKIDEYKNDVQQETIDS